MSTDNVEIFFFQNMEIQTFHVVFNLTCKNIVIGNKNKIKIIIIIIIYLFIDNFIKLNIKKYLVKFIDNNWKKFIIIGMKYLI